MKLNLIPMILILGCLHANAQYKNGHQYVDLGLPSGNLWATCNMGASHFTEPGDYYSWGELSTKYRYIWDTYKFYDSSRGIIKYNDSDGLTVLEPEDDVAYIKWGGNWQIPTPEDWQELYNHTRQYRVSEDGLVYDIFRSEHNSRELCFPMGSSFWLAAISSSGGLTEIDEFLGLGDNRNNLLGYVDYKKALAIFHYSTGSRCEQIDRYSGIPIRPVYVKVSIRERREQKRKAEEERLQKERDKMEHNEVELDVLTDYKPIYPGAKDLNESHKSFIAFVKNNIGIDGEYYFVGDVYIGKDGRVYDAKIAKKTSGPYDLEARFKRAALSSPVWTPAKKNGHLVRCRMIIHVRSQK